MLTVYRKIFYLLAGVLFTCVASSETIEIGPKTFDVDNGWTAIVAAYSPEIKAINQAIDELEYARITKTVTIKGVRYQIGTYKNEPIIIFTTGISIPNAAMTMQMALDYFPIDKVVMMGIAGAINSQYSPGDISVPERWYFHDESVYVNPSSSEPGAYILPGYYEKALKGYKAREKDDSHAPKYTNYGFMHPEEMSVVKEGWSQPRQKPYFSATPELIRLAHKAAKLNPVITMPSGKSIKVVVGGNGVTGSVFVDNAEYRQWLQQVYDAQVAEMESAAVGQVCFVNEVDWVVIRSVSDLAGAQTGQNEENVFDGIASGTGTRFMLRLLEQIHLSDVSDKDSYVN